MLNFNMLNKVIHKCLYFKKILELILKHHPFKVIIIILLCLILCSNFRIINIESTRLRKINKQISLVHKLKNRCDCHIKPLKRNNINGGFMYTDGHLSIILKPKNVNFNYKNTKSKSNKYSLDLSKLRTYYNRYKIIHYFILKGFGDREFKSYPEGLVINSNGTYYGISSVRSLKRKLKGLRKYHNNNSFIYKHEKDSNNYIRIKLSKKGHIEKYSGKSKYNNNDTQLEVHLEKMTKKLPESVKHKNKSNIRINFSH